MEREIWFRGKRMDNGEWVYGIPATFINVSGAPYTAIIPIYSFANDLAGLKEVDPATVGQYTGLTDKNGVKVFRGDIVRTVYDGVENVFVVVWDNDELDFKATNGRGNYGSGGFQYLPCCEEVEVIGNIHDNPELLEVQNETI